MRLRLLNVKSGGMEAPRAPLQFTPGNILYKIIFVLYGNIQKSFFIVHIYQSFFCFVRLVTILQYQPSLLLQQILKFNIRNLLKILSYTQQPHFSTHCKYDFIRTTFTSNEKFSTLPFQSDKK